jgi:hypothetical protein
MKRERWEGKYEWRRIATGLGAQRETVYWARLLPDGRRLTVARVYDEYHRPTKQWVWNVYPADWYTKGDRDPATVHRGPAPGVVQGRIIAEQMAGLR